MKKEIIKIIIKVALYALGLIAAYFGVSTMTSCSTSHNVAARGCTTIVTVDTTIVKHNGFVRSKNYLPYE
jgi:single-stranded DNA-specific DHH superfamily exonuclease